MKDCKKIHLLLSLYTEGQLSVREKNLVEKHLAFCVTARREMEQLNHLGQTLKNAPEPKMPNDLHDKIMARVTGKVVPLPTRRGFWTYTPWALGTAAVLAFLVLNKNSDWMDQWKVTAPRVSRDETGALSRQIESAGVESQGSRVLNASSRKPGIAAAKSVVAFKKEKFVSGNNAANLYSNNALIEKKLAVVRQDKDTTLKQKTMMNYKADRLEKPSEESAGASDFAKIAPKNLSEPQAGLASAGPQVQSLSTLEKRAFPAGTPAASAPPSSSISEADRSVKILATSKEKPIDFWEGTNGPATIERAELITDREAFKVDWQLLQPNQVPPPVDFTKQAVVFLTAGTMSTPGYSIEVSRLEEKTDQLVIWYKVESPAPGTVLAQVLTYPWSIQVIAKPNKPVVFSKE